MIVDLHRDGLLWLLNRVCFHPRGFALAHEPGTDVWELWGDGSEPWKFATPEEIADPSLAVDEDAIFTTVEALFARARLENT